MAITVQQIPAALQTVQQLGQGLQNISALLSQAQDLANNGWVINIGTSSPINVPVTPAQQSSLVAQYDALKTSLAALYSQLP